jgi:hypothetical protein
MAGRQNREAAPGQRAAASAPGGFCPAVLARLESESPSARLPAPRATPTPGDEPVASRRHFPTSRGGHPFPGAARAFASRLARAAGSQCPSFHRWSRHDQADRASRQPSLPRSGWRPRNLVLTTVGDLFLDKLESPGGVPCPLFWPILTSPSLLPVFALSPAGLVIVFRTPRPTRCATKLCAVEAAESECIKRYQDCLHQRRYDRILCNQKRGGHYVYCRVPRPRAASRPGNGKG